MQHSLAAHMASSSMTEWHDEVPCSRPDIIEVGGLATCMSCGAVREDEEGENVVEESQPYIYTPISQRGEIRVLVLQPGERNDPLLGELVTIGIFSNYQYEYSATSYTW